MRNGRWIGSIIIASAAGMVALLAWIGAWLGVWPAPW